jgi:hypothetical protein
MSTGRTKIIRRRVVAGVVVLVAAVSAPVAVAATSSSSPRAGVHTQVQRDGSVLVSGYDGGVSLQSDGR